MDSAVVSLISREISQPLYCAAGSNMDTRNGDGRSTLHMCIAHGDGSLRLFEAAMKQGPDLETLDGRNGFTALHWAVSRAADLPDDAIFVRMGKRLLHGEHRCCLC
jgi:hypothetical protein